MTSNISIPHQFSSFQAREEEPQSQQNQQKQKQLDVVQTVSPITTTEVSSSKLGGSNDVKLKFFESLGLEMAMGPSSSTTLSTFSSLSPRSNHDGNNTRNDKQLEPSSLPLLPPSSPISSTQVTSPWIQPQQQQQQSPSSQQDPRIAMMMDPSSGWSHPRIQQVMTSYEALKYDRELDRKHMERRKQKMQEQEKEEEEEEQRQQGKDVYNNNYNNIHSHPGDLDVEMMVVDEGIEGELGDHGSNGVNNCTNNNNESFSSLDTIQIIPEPSSWGSSNAMKDHTKHMTKAKTKKKKKKSLSFDETVKIVPIPERTEYSNRVKAVLWSTPSEIQQNAARNTLEFASEGWNWRNVLEDEHLYVCLATAELIHPCHYDPSMISYGFR